MKKNTRYIVAFVLFAFALLTLFLSSSVIFDWFGIRAMEGNYVPFIVWANFISSIIYLRAVFGFVTARPWTWKILGSSLVLLIFATIALQIYINSGGIYELKTPKAMIFRSAVTAIFTLAAYLLINKTNKEIK